VDARGNEQAGRTIYGAVLIRQRARSAAFPGLPPPLRRFRVISSPRADETNGYCRITQILFGALMRAGPRRGPGRFKRFIFDGGA